jgi:hypothetical protein
MFIEVDASQTHRHSAQAQIPQISAVKPREKPSSFVAEYGSLKILLYRHN